MLKLSQEEQTTLHLLCVKRIAHIDIALAGTERSVAVIVLEVEQGTLIQNDVTTLTGINSQVSLIALVLQRLLCELG